MGLAVRGHLFVANPFRTEGYDWLAVQNTVLVDYVAGPAIPHQPIATALEATDSSFVLRTWRIAARLEVLAAKLKHEFAVAHSSLE